MGGSRGRDIGKCSVTPVAGPSHGLAATALKEGCVGNGP
jgi:hypothetical protein